MKDNFMRVCGLFTGLAGWEKPFIMGGHQVFMTDNNPHYARYLSICDDILNITPQDIIEHLGGKPHVMVLSPPCTTFSISAAGYHWHKPEKDGVVSHRKPKTEAAVKSIEIIEHCLYLIEELNPDFWIMENPRGLLRKLPQLQGINRKTVWYCQYGESNAKPTDIWGNWPEEFIPRPECSNSNHLPGKYCHHDRQPRGYEKKKAMGVLNKGTQGKRGNGRISVNAVRSEIPEQLAKQWYRSCLKGWLNDS